MAWIQRVSSVRAAALLLLLGFSAAAFGAHAPGREPADANSCPTLRWDGSHPGVDAWELVVYPVDAEGAILGRPTLWAWLPAGTESWTPAPEDCLEPGRYAWSVRAVGRGKAEPWTEPTTVEVSSVTAPPAAST